MSSLHNKRMSTGRSKQAISLASVHSLNNNESNKKPIVWKDFGVYLDKKLDTHLNPDIGDTLAASSLINKSSLDNSYLSQVIKYKVCKSCNRPIGDKSLESHFSKCSEMKHKKQQEEDSSSSNYNNSTNKRKRGRGAANPLLDIEPSSADSSRNTTPISGTPVSTNGLAKPKKKYKKSQTQKEKEAANAAAAAANSNGSSVPSSAGTGNGVGKKKKQPKPKNLTKPKGPVDVEKQCGVPLPSGGYCARSLTCKTHSMGAKRAVLGRSAPYDVLLQQYQKRNQAKLAANNALAVQRRENAAFNGGNENDEDGMASNGMYNKVLDADEETHLVLEGVSKNYPIPLERKVMLPTRNRHKFLYMREAYANALINTGNNNTTSNSSASNSSSDLTLANQAISGSMGGLQGRCALVNVDQGTSNGDSLTQNISSIVGEMYLVRAPLKAILLTSQHNTMQQQLFQQQIMKLQQQQMMLMKQRQARAQQQQQQQKQQQQT